VVDHVGLPARAFANVRREAAVADEQEAQVRSGKQRGVGGCKHQVEPAAFDQLPAEDRDPSMRWKRVAATDAASIHRRHRRDVTPDGCDQNLLFAVDPEPLAQIGGIAGQRADDRGETLQKLLLPRPREPKRQAAWNAADLVMMVGKKIPNEEKATGDSRPYDLIDERGDRYCGHPRNHGIEAGEVEIAPGNARRVSAAQNELARLMHQSSRARHVLRWNPHHAHATACRELFDRRI